MAKFSRGMDFNFGANAKPKAAPKAATKTKGGKRQLSANQRATAHFYMPTTRRGSR